MTRPRIIVTEDFLNDGILVYARRDFDTGKWLIRKGGHETTFLDAVAQGSASPLEPADSLLRIPDDVAMALRDALTVHYGGAPETAWLRKDYDAERKRVDTLTEAIISRLRSPI